MAVCIEILKYFASIHEGGADDYFQKVSRMSQKGKYLIQKNEIPVGAEISWSSVSSRWVFNTHEIMPLKLREFGKQQDFVFEMGNR